MTQFENIIKQQELLKVLASSKGNMRKVILQNADKKLIAAICEIIYNLLEQNLDINTSDLEKLKKYKHTFRKLIKKSDLKTKKKILVQNGGFLQLSYYWNK